LALNAVSEEFPLVNIAICIAAGSTTIVGFEIYKIIRLRKNIPHNKPLFHTRSQAGIM
jgi:hypothetical protein